MGCELITLEVYQVASKKSRDERIKEILDAGKKAFLIKGFKNTFMEDIIAETSLSKGGFYYYYKDKKDIFFEILKIASDQSISALISQKEQLNSREQFKEFFKMMLCDGIFNHSDEAKMYRIFVSEIYGNAEFLEQLKALEAGYFVILNDLFGDVFPALSESEVDEKVRLLYHTFHAMSYYVGTLKLEKLYSNNRSVLEKIFDDIF